MGATGSPLSLAGSALVAHRWAKTPNPGAADLDRFKVKVDPNGELSEDERTQLAEQARREFRAEMGRRSGAARRARRVGSAA
ncbi:MAG: hypothetical protein QOI89_3774 [Solirubrobacteraceae bacterium]|jgi:hypothetical protein|nr:hypothetical protein [Solirubrobacteraceae bacterium]